MFRSIPHYRQLFRKSPFLVFYSLQSLSKILFSDSYLCSGLIENCRRSSKFRSEFTIYLCGPGEVVGVQASEHYVILNQTADLGLLAGSFEIARVRHHMEQLRQLYHRSRTPCLHQFLQGRCAVAQVHSDRFSKGIQKSFVFIRPGE